ncbi:lipopolysaccharide biosynthesis protein [Collinsella tanakaei]|uniref:lipopolysaccharide biosynthesis protein n=1 Tax=Collinsella tanakaei TaxID=626935 RepID=UPI001F17E2C1|nr:oligosaccharide flippase family protein [Collinsella tanakaei]MCF2622201.1 oligosaccharide flippase family protein [Collinsella tanakaei]
MNSVTDIQEHAKQFLVDEVAKEAEGLRRQRSRKLLLASGTAIAAKALAMLAPLITIQVTFNYLGQEVYGLWNTGASFFALFAYADLGLGSGVATELGKASGKENSVEQCRRIISSAYTVLIIVATAILILFCMIYPLCDWGAFLNAESERTLALVGGVVLAIVMPRILSIPLSLVQRTQIALQDGFNSYLWQCVGSILSIAAVYVINWMDLGSLAIIWANSMINVFVLLANTIYYYIFRKRALAPSFSLVNWETMKRLLRLGLGFFALSFLTNLGLTLDSYIVGVSQNLSEAASYSILYKVVQVVTAVCTLISNNLWGANGEAMARGDYSWVKTNTIKMSLLFFVVTLSISITVFLFVNPAVTLLLHKNLSFSPFLVSGMCLMQIILATLSPHFMVLNSAGCVKIQMVLFGAYTPLSFFLKLILCQVYGASVVPWVGAICYLMIIVPGVLFAEKRILAGRV